jgi:hypothetical protein
VIRHFFYRFFSDGRELRHRAVFQTLIHQQLKRTEKRLPQHGLRPIAFWQFQQQQVQVLMLFA